MHVVRVVYVCMSTDLQAGMDRNAFVTHDPLPISMWVNNFSSIRYESNSDKTSDKEDPQKQLTRGKGGLLDPEKNTGHTGAAGSEGNWLERFCRCLPNINKCCVESGQTLLNVHYTYRDSRGHTGTLEATHAGRGIQSESRYASIRTLCCSIQDAVYIYICSHANNYGGGPRPSSHQPVTRCVASVPGRFFFNKTWRSIGDWSAWGRGYKMWCHLHNIFQRSRVGCVACPMALASP